MTDHQSFVTYQSYLKLPELLSLQRTLADPEEHDEMLFIVVHQVYELWFKVLLHEMDEVGAHLEDDEAHRAATGLKRVLKILKVLVAQLDIVETMTPVDFNSFRHRLESASGFQSAQFRELEFVLGSKRASVVHRFPAESDERDRLERRLAEPALWDRFLRFLAVRGYAVPATVLDRDFATPPSPDERVQAELVRIYQEDPELTSLCEQLVDLDEGVQEWRYHHVKMVERTIGTKPGTGGSLGAAYLQSTLGRPAFPDLWAIRTAL